MKTLQQIQQMKNANLEQIRLMGVPSDAQKSEYRRLKKEVEFLLIIEMYLESKPAPEFVKKEQARLTNRLELIRKGQPPYPENEGAVSFWKKKVAEYNKLMGVSDIQLKLRTLNFLLSPQ